MKKNKNLILTLLAVLTVIIITGGVTYAFFSYTGTGTTDNLITTDTITFLYTEVDGVGNGIKIENAFPISDEKGKVLTGTNEYFDFKVTSKTASTIAIPYEITARKSKDSDDIDEYIRVYLTKGETNEEVLLDNYSKLTQTEKVDENKWTEKVIYTDTVPANESNYEQNFRLRMWIDEETDFSAGTMNDKTFTLTVNVYANAEVVNQQQSTYTEALLNGADPVLTANTTTASSSNVVRLSNTETTKQLIPVIIDNTGKVTKANINEKWYSYEDKEWANAIILTDEGKVEEDGTILESSIESYFVWIPKYSYQLWDLGNYTGLTSIGSSERVINIRFGLDDTSDENTGECTTPGVAGSSGNCSVVDGIGDYMTHPAFLAFDTTGFWVGKFETGFDGAIADTTTEMNTSDYNKIIIKPNVYSWRNNIVGNMFKASLDYLEDYDSHMMKNTEWGAVAYLQHSQYGSATSVRINNNGAYITGYAATEEPTKGHNGGQSIEGNRNESTIPGVDGTWTVHYLNPASQVASTTGNYSGIYDISGGAWDCVMGYTTGSTIGVGGTSGITSLYSDFFTNVKYTKYYDKYSSTVETNYNNRILGDATGEMGPFGSKKDPDINTRNKSSWYENHAYFTISSYPWFARGAYWADGSSAGNFAFSYGLGGVSVGGSFRIVLAPTK